MQNIAKFAFKAFKPQYSNIPMRKLMKLQQQQQMIKTAFNFVNSNRSSLSYLSSFRFSTEKRCKNNADKVCENKGGCHSEQNHHHHHHENGCCDHGQATTTQGYQEDSDITRLKDLLNTFSKDNPQQHQHKNGCCGGQMECGSKVEKEHNHEHHHEHEHGCCGGHHHHHEHHHHEHSDVAKMSGHIHEHNVQNHHNHEHSAEHHHHEHDGCCGHDHHHDHGHHHHDQEPIDIEALSKQKIEEKEFKLTSGENVSAVFSGDNTVSYSISGEIKGVKAREAEHGQLVMIFTCTVCDTRSARSFTKKAYNEGVVLIRCETCDSLHLVADNLGWFDEGKKTNVETLMEEKGEKVHKIDNSEAINDIISQFINKEENSATQNS